MMPAPAITLFAGTGPSLPIRAAEERSAGGASAYAARRPATSRGWRCFPWGWTAMHHILFCCCDAARFASPSRPPLSETFLLK